MKKLIVFTPVNPIRPFAEYLGFLHNANVYENIMNCPMSYDINYVEESVFLPDIRQKQGLYRGQNVVRAFNEVYDKYKEQYEYICKWDDDILLPKDILLKAIDILDTNPEALGCGLFSTQYGAPNILMANQESEGFTNSFQRFYVYRMNVWNHIEIVASGSGDPDQAYQWSLEGKKIRLDIPHVHLDHRACQGNDDLYRVLLDMAYWMYYQ